MASLTLKNLPEVLLSSLRAAAEKDRRSLTQEIIHLLDQALQEHERQPAAPRANVEAQIAAWRKLAGKWQSDVDHGTEAKRIIATRSLGRKVEL